MKSTKIAVFFLIILLLVLVYVTYIKFTYVKIDEPNNTNQNNSISLSTIENNYNNLNEVLELKKESISTIATTSDNNLEITYKFLDNENNTNDYNYTYIFTFTNGILKNTTSINDNKQELDSLNKVFINLALAVAVSMGCEESEAKLTTLLALNEDFVSDSFKIINSDNDITYVIDTTKKINLYKSNNTYNEVNILDITTSNYSVDMNNTTIENIKFDYIEKEEFKGFTLSAYITKNDSNSKAILKIYDKDKVELTNKELDLSEFKNIEKISINIELDDKIKKEDVNYYSIEVKEND